MNRFTSVLLVVGALVVATAAVSQSRTAHRSAPARSASVVATPANTQGGGTCPLGTCPIGSCPLGSQKAAKSVHSDASAMKMKMSSVASNECSDPASCPTGCSRDGAASSAVAVTAR